MNTYTILLLGLAFAMSACKPKLSKNDPNHVENRAAPEPDFILIGRHVEEKGKIVVGAKGKRGALLLGGNHCFATGENLASGGWKMVVLRLKPSHLETFVEIEPGQQIYLDDNGQSRSIDGTFDLTGAKPVWTGLHQELKPIIVSALENTIIAQQDGGGQPATRPESK